MNSTVVGVSPLKFVAKKKLNFVNHSFHRKHLTVQSWPQHEILA